MTAGMGWAPTPAVFLGHAWEGLTSTGPQAAAGISSAASETCRVRVPPLPEVAIIYNGLTREALADSLEPLLPCEKDHISLLVDGKEASTSGPCKGVHTVLLAPSAKFLTTCRLMPTFHSWTVTGLNKEGFRSVAASLKVAAVETMLRKGVVAMQGHRLSEVGLRTLEAKLRGAEVVGIPAVLGPKGKAAGGVAVAVPAAAGWRTEGKAQIIVPGRALKVDLAWRTRKFRIVVLHLAPGQQGEILDAVCKDLDPSTDSQHAILGDFNTQAIIHS